MLQVKWTTTAGLYSGWCLERSLPRVKYFRWSVLIQRFFLQLLPPKIRSKTPGQNMLHMIATYSYYIWWMMIRVVKVGVQQYWIAWSKPWNWCQLTFRKLRWRRFWTTWERNNLEANVSSSMNIRNDDWSFNSTTWRYHQQLWVRLV
jgi:hypothetical protein